MIEARARKSSGPLPDLIKLNAGRAVGIVEAHVCGNAPYNAVNGARDDIWDSTSAVSEGGIGRRQAGATAVKLYSPTNTAAGDFTVVWYGRPETIPGAYTSIWDKGNGGTRENTLFVDTTGAVSYVGVGGTANGWTPGVSIISGRQNVVVLRRSGSLVSVCINGKFGTTTFTSSGTSTSSDGYFWMGLNVSGGGSNLTGVHNYLLVFKRAISDGEALNVCADPGWYFRKSPSPLVFIPSAAGGATDGSLSKTVDAVTLSATGAVDVAGSLSKSVANVTLSAAGAVDVVGTLAKSLANVTLVSAGTIDLVGTLSANVAAVTLSSAGSVSDGPSGSLSVVLANVGVSATGTVDISGSSSFTVGSVSLSATGGVDVTGTLSATTGSVTLSSAGTVGTTVSEGVLSATIANVSVVSAGTVSVSGTLSSTLADVTLVAYESVVVPPAQTTGGGGSRPILIREKSLRDELSELRKQRMEAALLRQIQREDEEIVLIMAALAA